MKPRPRWPSDGCRSLDATRRTGSEARRTLEGCRALVANGTTGLRARRREPAIRGPLHPSVPLLRESRYNRPANEQRAGWEIANGR
jgi:hypothetical protein